MKTVIITGATSGIGFATAKALAQQGDRVIGVGRTKEHCDKAKQAIQALIPHADVTYFYADLAQQSELNALADQLCAHLDTLGVTLDVLVNNAGGVRNWYTTTRDGYELQFALNYLSAFLLTHRLMPYLEKSNGRVILTGSNSHKHARLQWDGIMFEKHYSCLWAYKQSKLCGMLFAAEFNRRFAEKEVRAYVADPGLVNTDIGVKQTSGVVSKFWAMRSKHGVSPEVSAMNHVFLCNQTPAPEGLYYYRCEKRAYDKRVDDEQLGKRLFVRSERLCGITFFEGGQIK